MDRPPKRRKEKKEEKGVREWKKREGIGRDRFLRKEGRRKPARGRGKLTRGWGNAVG
jgi:hypothetical protein